MSEFTVDPAFEAGSHRAADGRLCQVRLQDDVRFPWLILIPRVTGAVELADLAPVEQARLMQEIVAAGDLVRWLGRESERDVEKLNVAALGNVTAQLHVHVVGRRRDDGLWPDPIWGRPGAKPYAPHMLERMLKIIAEDMPGPSGPV
ncbi:HIT domain-containing protein [Brevundimonas sp. NIBR11]|uniref:HIT domain-containing protein n=1 Tax=Brevundimonas sp. NIBR11 TaxID=3015999 RepID=UPI0022F10213|nr:HIT domain-containing protein [Brevundimonas sp. NIBR11]WGM32736.1 hypothetical protein KKHFBJBL_02990 [Brevundimonas sp. NIBR11]